MHKQNCAYACRHTLHVRLLSRTTILKHTSRDKLKRRETGDGDRRWKLHPWDAYCPLRSGGISERMAPVLFCLSVRLVTANVHVVLLCSDAVRGSRSGKFCRAFPCRPVWTSKALKGTHPKPKSPPLPPPQSLLYELRTRGQPPFPESIHEGLAREVDELWCFTGVLVTSYKNYVNTKTWGLKR